MAVASVASCLMINLHNMKYYHVRNVLLKSSMHMYITVEPLLAAPPNSGRPPYNGQNVEYGLILALI